MSFLKGFSIAMGANALLFVLSFLNNKLLYVYLSTEDNGLYFLIMQFSLFFTMIFGEWLRLTNINIAGSDKKFTPVLSSNILVYSGSIGIILATIFIVSPSMLEPIFPDLPRQYIVAVIVVGLLLVIRNCFQSLLLVNNRLFQYGTTFVLWGLLFLVLDFFILVIFDLGLQFIIYALAFASAAAALWAIISSSLTNGFSVKPSLKVFGMSGKLGLRAAVAVTGVFLMINIHTFMINSLEGLFMVGIFSICFRIFQLLQKGTNIAGNVMYANVASSEEKNGYRITMLVNRNIIFFSVLCAVIMVLFGKMIITIISQSSYLSAYKPLLYMLPGIVFINTASILNSSYWARGYPVKVIAAPFVAAAIGFFADMFLVPGIGASGAAISFSGTSFLWFFYIVMVFRKDSGFSLYEIIIPHISDYIHIMSTIKLKLSREKT